MAAPIEANDRRLFGHYLWNASLLVAELIEAGTLGTHAGPGPDAPLPSLTLPTPQDDQGHRPPASRPPTSPTFSVSDLSVLELGAGAALPSILAALLGASTVAVTDYPTDTLLSVLEDNVRRNTGGLGSAGQEPLPALAVAGAPSQQRPNPPARYPGRTPTRPERIAVSGHAWGDTTSTPFAQEHRGAFDRVIAADCLWMPWQHGPLRASIAWFLGAGPRSRAWVAAGFHTGRDKMRGFFDAEGLAEVGLEVEAMWERDCNGVEREWVADRGVEDVGVRKRWLVVAILKRIDGARPLE